MTGLLTVAERLARNDPDFLEELRIEAARNVSRRSLPELEYGLGIETTFDQDVTTLPFENNDVTVTVSEDTDIDTAIGTAFPGRYETEAAEAYASLVKPGNRFQCLHHALAIPVLVYAPAGVDASATLHINYTAAVGSVHVLVLTGHNADLDILTVYQGDADFTTSAAEVVAAEGSHVTYTVSQELGEETTHVAERISQQGKDATVEWHETHFGGKLVKTEVTSTLTKQGAETRNNGLFLSNNRQHVDLLNGVKHRAPHTDSDLETRGVQYGKSTSICRGVIDIGRDAANITGSQHASTLLLSDEARNSSLPILEINNDDVDTEHAATTTQLDEEKLFYMASRGIPEDEAKRLVVNGFFQPVVKHLPPYSKDRVTENIAERVTP